jgi:hypothetical protein
MVKNKNAVVPASNYLFRREGRGALNSGGALKLKRQGGRGGAKKSAPAGNSDIQFGFTT